MTLSRSEVQKYYDRFGKKQDSQGFYELPAIGRLIAHAGFKKAQSVLEFGCGTGKLAARLLTDYLGKDSEYVGCDISPTMIGLAAERLAPFANRARVVRTDGSIKFPAADHSVDRVLSAYVLDLLSQDDTNEFLCEAQRVLTPEGLLCLVSLTNGPTVFSKLVSLIWSSVFRIRASLVGGCRPIDLRSVLSAGSWKIEFQEKSVSYGIASEVVIARPQ